MSMNLYIKLPPDEEREKMIHAWVNGMLDGAYDEFFGLLNELTEKGFSPNGIMCLLLHDQTTDEIKERIEDKSSHVLTEALFAGPICLN